MNKTAILLIALSCTIVCTLAQNKRTVESSKATFTLPSIPAALTSPEGRAAYLVAHYWDRFDFADTALISCPEITEQAFVDFIDLLPYIPQDKAIDTITGVMDAAMRADSTMFAHFAEMSEKYLYDPNSPFRNEEYYIPVLQYIVSSPNVDEISRIRPQYQLEMAMKNRPGMIAADFTYTLRNGKTGKMLGIAAKYTILYFNNPDCHDCQRVKNLMAKSSVINKLLEDTVSSKNKLAILSIYPDSDLPIWLNAVYPRKWINGYDAERIINDRQLYDLKAIPTLYLLDSNKRVILKDAPIEVVETWLSEHAINSRSEI